MNEPETMDRASERPTTLSDARRLAQSCERCPLYRNATQTVFGEGPVEAPLMFVGEQPGDREDLAGKPFVGPAGKLLDELLAAAGIDRQTCYVTNAVKHFKFEPRGKLRLHKRPDAYEIDRCRWWLDLERRFVKPRLIVALGATAAQSLTGRGSAILRRRGTVERLAGGTRVFITIHPSMLLRIPDPTSASEAREAFRRDLVKVANLMNAA
jgi:DNA polymerase